MEDGKIDCNCLAWQLHVISSSHLKREGMLRGVRRHRLWAWGVCTGRKSVVAGEAESRSPLGSNLVPELLFYNVGGWVVGTVLLLAKIY